MSVGGESDSLKPVKGLAGFSAKRCKRALDLGMRHACQEIMINLAGMVCEGLKHGTADLDAAGVDLRTIHRWLRELEMQNSAVLTFAEQTRGILTDQRTWAAVERIAKRLLQARQITGADVERICHALEVPRVESHRGAKRSAGRF